MAVTFDVHDKLIGAWLLSQVIQQIEADQRDGYEDARRPVALKTASNLEGLDFLLTRLDKKIKYLKNEDVL